MAIWMSMRNRSFWEKDDNGRYRSEVYEPMVISCVWIGLPTSDCLQKIVDSDRSFCRFRYPWIYTIVVQLSAFLCFDDSLISSQGDYTRQISRKRDDGRNETTHTPFRPLTICQTNLSLPKLPTSNPSIHLRLHLHRSSNHLSSWYQN